jgi:hypothetical protein
MVPANPERSDDTKIEETETGKETQRIGKREDVALSSQDGGCLTGSNRDRSHRV